MFLEEVDAVERLLEFRRHKISRQRVGIGERPHAQSLSAAIRLEDKAPLAKGFARRLNEAALACDSDGPRYGHPSARQGPVLAHLAYLEIRSAERRVGKE